MIKVINLIKTINVLIPVSLRFERILVLVGDRVNITCGIVQGKSYGTTHKATAQEVLLSQE